MWNMVKTLISIILKLDICKYLEIFTVVVSCNSPGSFIFWYKVHSLSRVTWLCGFIKGLENLYDICDLYEYYDKYISVAMIYRRSPWNCLENIMVYIELFQKIKKIKLKVGLGLRIQLISCVHQNISRIFGIRI